MNPFYVQEIAEALKGVNIPVLVKNPIHVEIGLWAGAIERFQKAAPSVLQPYTVASSLRPRASTAMNQNGSTTLICVL